MSANQSFGNYTLINLDGGRVSWSVGDRGQRCYLGAYPHAKRTGSIFGKARSQW